MAKHINWNSYNKYFKIMSDKDIAKMLGCSVSQVTLHRALLTKKSKTQDTNNIITNQELIVTPKKSNNKFVDKYNWDKFDNLLGTDIDRNIAKIVGCSKAAIANRRKKLGIKAFKRS
jgi:hypothetical protein